MDSNIIGNQKTSLTAVTDTYYPLYGANLNGSTTEFSSASNNWTVMPIAGTLKSFYINQDTPSGVGVTRKWIVRKNSVDTSLEVDITGALQSTGSDTVDTVSFSAGDIISIHTSATGITTGTGTVRWSLLVNASANVSMISGSADSAMGTTFPVYLAPQGANIDKTSTPANVEMIMPTAGTIKNAYVKLSSAIASGKDVTFTLVQNGTPTSLAVTINTAVDNGSDLTAGHAVTVAAADRFYWQVTSSVAPASKGVSIGAEFDPTTNGESVHMFGGSQTPSISANRFISVNATDAAFSASESNQQQLTNAAVWKKLYVYQKTALSGAGTYQYQLSVNTTPGNPTVTMSSSSQNGNDTSNTISTNAGDTVDIKVIPTSSPTTSGPEWGIVSYIAPAGTTTSTSSSTSTSSTSSSTSTSISSTSTSHSTSTSISSTSSSTSTTQSTSTSISSTSSSTSTTQSTSTSVSSTSSSTSTTQSTSTSVSSTSSSTSTTHSTSTSISSTSSSTSTTVSFTTSTSSTSTSISTSTSLSTSSTSTSTSISTSTSLSTTSHSTSTSLSTSTSSTSTSITTSTSFSTSSTSMSTSSTSTSTTTLPAPDFGFRPRGIIRPVRRSTSVDSRRPLPSNIKTTLT